jgi:hypothetical protein
MEGTFRVTFDDGTHEDVQAANADAAKGKARAVRYRVVDPGGAMDRVERERHASIKIASVAEVTDGDRSRSGDRADRGPRGGREGVGNVLTSIALLLAGALLYQLDALTVAQLGTTTHADVMSLVGASGTAIGATIAALAAVTGDSLQVPVFGESKKGMILQWWTDVQVAGTARIRSPKLHDNVQGLRHDTIISDLTPILPWGFGQRIYAGDTLLVDLAGSAVAGDIEYVVMLQWFEELGGQVGRFITPEQVNQRTVNLVAVENTIATGATAAWAGAEAINVEIDQFHANTDYALIGYHVDTEVPAIAWRGPDTANLRVGGPGLDVDSDITAQWFATLSRAFNRPLIPVIQANNKAATNIDALQDENGADTTVISIYAELAKS